MSSEIDLTDLDLETTLGDEDWKLVDDWNKCGRGLTALLARRVHPLREAAGARSYF